MGLDIGVIPAPIKYMGRPSKEVYNFVWHLDSHADDGNWNVSSGGNTIVEYTRENMERQTKEYIEVNDLTQEEADNIRAWVDELPWDQDHIMLHYSW